MLARPSDIGAAPSRALTAHGVRAGDVAAQVEMRGAQERGLRLERAEDVDRRPGPRGALGPGDRGLHLVEPAGEQRRPAADQAQPPVGRDRARRQRLQPARDGAGVEIPRLQPVRGDQRGGVLDPAGGDRVVDRLVDAPAGRVPRRRAGVQLGHEVRLGAREFALQQVAQQVVVAEPVAAVVERDDEQVRPERLGEQRARCPPGR